MTIPASLIADGMLRVDWVPAIANPDAPSLTELNGASAIEMTCYLTPDGYTPATDEAVVNDDRLCSRDSFERRGRRTNTLAVTYVYRPQEAAAADNKAFDTLKEGTLGYFIERWGADYEDAFAVGDVVNVVPVESGVQVESAPEANSTLRIAQKQFVRGPKSRQVAVVI